MIVPDSSLTSWILASFRFDENAKIRRMARSVFSTTLACDVSAANSSAASASLRQMQWGARGLAVLHEEDADARVLGVAHVRRLVGAPDHSARSSGNCLEHALQLREHVFASWSSRFVASTSVVAPRPFAARSSNATSDGMFVAALPLRPSQQAASTWGRPRRICSSSFARACSPSRAPPRRDRRRRVFTLLKLHKSEPTVFFCSSASC